MVHLWALPTATRGEHNLFRTFPLWLPGPQMAIAWAMPHQLNLDIQKNFLHTSNTLSLVCWVGGGKGGMTASHRASSIRMSPLPCSPTHHDHSHFPYCRDLSFTLNRDSLSTPYSTFQPRMAMRITYNTKLLKNIDASPPPKRSWDDFGLGRSPGLHFLREVGIVCLKLPKWFSCADLPRASHSSTGIQQWTQARYLVSWNLESSGASQMINIWMAKIFLMVLPGK